MEIIIIYIEVKDTLILLRHTKLQSAEGAGVHWPTYPIRALVKLEIHIKMFNLASSRA